MTGRILALGLGLIVLLGLGYAFWTLHNDRVMHDERDAALRTELAQIRKAIRRFTEEKGRGPHSLDELVPQYLRRIPADPVTHQVNWQVEMEEEVVPSNDFGTAPPPSPQSFVVNVRSAAGPPYSEY